MNSVNSEIKGNSIREPIWKRLVMHHRGSIKLCYQSSTRSASTDFQKVVSGDWEANVVVQCGDHGPNRAESSSQMHNFCGPRRIPSTKSGLDCSWLAPGVCKCELCIKV